MTRNNVGSLPARLSQVLSRLFTDQRRTFFSQVATLVSGTVLAQAILVLASPFLTRLYDPEDIASLQMYTIWTGLIAAFASGRYDLAIMLAESEEDRRAVAWLSILLGLIISMTSGLLVVFFSYASPAGSTVVGAPSLAVWMIPLGSMAYAWNVVVHRWESWNNRFRTLATSQVYGGIVTVALQFLFAFPFRNPTGTQLVAANLIGLMVTCQVMSGDFVSELWKTRSEFRWERLVTNARRYWQFPTFSTAAHLLGRITVEVPKLMIAALFTPASLGLFSLSLRVAQLPLTFIGQAFGHVFFRKVADCRGDSKKVRLLLSRSALLLAALIAPPMLILYLWAEPMFGLIFGADWAEAGSYARLMIPWMVAGFIVQPLSYCLQAFEKQLMVFLWNLVLLPIGLASVYVGFLLEDVRWSILLYSIAMMVMFVAYYAMCMNIAANMTPQDQPTSKTVEEVGT